jgi:MYXO-CTERM domain-containing protein
MSMRVHFENRNSTIARLAAVGAAVAALGGLPVIARADIIVNGGFETGDFSGWNTHGPAITVATFARTGRFSAQFGSHILLTNQISQSVSDDLLPGQMYRIDLWVYNVVTGGPGGDRLTVGVGAVNQFHQFPVSTPIEVWTLVSHTFVQGELFNDPFLIDGYDDDAAFFVDDVSITPVPTPGAAGVFGLAGVVASRRRRR